MESRVTRLRGTLRRKPSVINRRRRRAGDAAVGSADAERDGAGAAIAGAASASAASRSGEITRVILAAAERARSESKHKGHPEPAAKTKWPIQCVVGPGLEGAIACETKIGYVNGTEGRLIYRGYDIFDLCAHATFEEVAYLLVYGELPSESHLDSFNRRLVESRRQTTALRMLMGFPLEQMNPMAALRVGANMLRHELTWRDSASGRPSIDDAIASDEDSIPMETQPMGESRAIYEFRNRRRERPEDVSRVADDAAGIAACPRVISGMATIAAGIARLREGKLPIEPDLQLGHAANFLYMMTGRRPTPEEERIMDVGLILHADHGMNASTFACMVVASTMSDIYFSIGAGIGALNGPLHGGANEQVVRTLAEIGSPENVDAWFRRAHRQRRKIAGFGHRVYKTYDPRARILGPLVEYLVKKNSSFSKPYATARRLEQQVVATLGQKKVFPNVDFYSGLVYSCMGLSPEMFTPIFAVSRVAGWTARVLEYLANNRIFRPRAHYIGDFGKTYLPLEERDGGR